MSTDYKIVPTLPILPLDHLQGIASCGTAVYSNKDPLPEKVPKDFDRFAPDGGFGTAHQCVCFARRILWNRFGFILPDIDVAAQIFHIPYIFDKDLKKQPVKSIENGTSTKPSKDAFIIYAGHTGNFPGHIGWIAEVDDDRVYIVDQNRYYHSFNGKTYTASFPLVHDKNKNTWTIQDEEEPVIGWVTFPTAGEPDLSRYEDAKDKAHKVWPRADTKSKNKHPVSRDMPQSLLDNYPSYDPSFKRWSWYYVVKDFRPLPVLLPVTLAWMFLQYMIYYPLKHKILRMLGMMKKE